jgi:predicted glycogen debranching enzyme
VRTQFSFDTSSRLEWLEANGLGGYASSTVSGANTRRYHGLLVPAVHPPVGRFVLLSKLEERVIVDGRAYELSSNQYRGAINPRGFELLDSFERDLFPVFEYAFEGFRLRKTIAAIHDENTTIILYELVQAAGNVTLELRPFIAGRDYHSLTHANDAIRREGPFEGGVFSLQPYDGQPELFLQVPGASFNASADWYYGYEYAVEEERGLDALEDLFTPGAFLRSLAPGERVAVIASTRNPGKRDGALLVAAEGSRREAVVRKASVTGSLGRTLVLAADQFIVRRGAGRRTVIAGYHWFTDWGRDTMISLPGLCLAIGRFEDARQILLAFAESVSEGMLPNRFPDGGEAPEYNTVDATLWFFVAAQQYLDSSADEPFVRDTLLAVLRDIVAWHQRGTRHNIHEDSDGLLIAGAAGDQLTWMDARVGDEAITPRHGKPVEINALWYNALSILSGFERRWGLGATAQRLDAKAAGALLRFRELFWNETAGCLYDVVDGDARDASLRPNQLFALSLPHPLLEGAQAESVLATVEAKLLTTVGLRTLSPDDPRFLPTYTGPPWQRDRAYHQGTVWPWLLGPFVTALIRVRGAAGIAQAQKILSALEPHLNDVCAGGLAEIYDGAPPHAPRGCISQAWSVAEALRCLRALP